MSRSEAIQHGWTNYSCKLPGDGGNYYWSVQAAVHAEGYVGITQWDEHGRITDQVLLSPAQWREIVRFVREERPR